MTDVGQITKVIQNVALGKRIAAIGMMCDPWYCLNVTLVDENDIEITVSIIPDLDGFYLSMGRCQLVYIRQAEIRLENGHL